MICTLLPLLVLLLMPFPSNSAVRGPQSAFSRPHVVVIVANRLLLADLSDPSLPTIRKMLREGGVGLISPNCAGYKTEWSVLLTANAGSPCRGGSYLKEFYDADEMRADGMKAGDAYSVRTGRKAPTGSAVFLGIGQALRDAAKFNSVPSKLGALGDALHAAGIRTMVSGNADVAPDEIDRAPAALAMDSRGIVDAGALSSSRGLQAGSASPTGSGDLTVIYFSRPTELDALKASMTDAAFALQKAIALKNLDQLADSLISRKNTKLMLVSFCPPAGGSWDQLTPMIIYPAKRPGLLISQTARTPGIIAASDFAPTVLSMLGLRPSSDMIGRAASVVPQGRGFEKLSDMGSRVTTNQRVLTPVAVFLVALGALSFTPAALIVAFGLKPSRKILLLLKAGLVVGSSTFAALLLAVLAPAGPVGYIAGMAVSMAALTGLCLGLAWSFRRKVTTSKLPAALACVAALLIVWADTLLDCGECMPGIRVPVMLLAAACCALAIAWRPHPGPLPRERGHVRALPVALMYAATALVILVDALCGCYLCKWSGPSSYQITGMRFYGIGNEYAGVLVSTAALAALFSGRRWLAPLAGLATIIVLGSGGLGANYGATATAVVTFVLLWLAVSRGGFGARHVVLAFGLAIATVVVFAVLDWALAGQAGSHAARATGMSEKLGAGYLVSLAMRKVLFNLRITFSTEGLHYALAFVPFLALWFGSVRGKVRQAFKSDPHVAAGMQAVLIGAVAAFLLNDSGIIFAGIMMAMTILILLYSLLEEVAPCRES